MTEAIDPAQTCSNLTAMLGCVASTNWRTLEPDDAGSNAGHDRHTMDPKLGSGSVSCVKGR